MGMNDTVVLLFSNVATWQSSDRSKPGIAINPEIVEWMAQNNQDIKNPYIWLLGSAQDRWKVRFILKDKATAVLFKLTFGGR